ncbi:MAG: response regulator [Geminicoccaceae bacterium]|nr:response regulator [Geminicoccaceae bacterium]
MSRSASAGEPGAGASAGRVVRQLPCLRRLARAVTGDQENGDAVVASALRSLLEQGDGQALERLTPIALRLRLFGTLCSALLARDAAADVSAPRSEGRGPGSVVQTIANARIVDRRLKMLGLRERLLLLLVKLERFSLAEAATILEMDEEAARETLDRARLELKRQERSRILIIEDEPLIALDIASIVQGDGHEVVGVARTRAEAVALAESGHVELILADIQLADESSGLDAVADILRFEHVPVIFITAFPERLLTGRRPEPTFLVTKPFDEETLAISIAQAQAMASVARA